MTELNTDRRFHNLTKEQVQTLDQVLTEVIPIHGRGNFPTLEVKPKDIIHVVRNRLMEKEIKVRDVRLNGSTASHVLVKENGTSYKDLDIIFGVELPKQEDFQIIKEVVLGCLLDFLPRGVNKDKITALTMKEAYVQKMVKVFTEHDRWSLISLSNNSGKNVELKFVNSLRRQFEFSVDSFQIILDRMLESYLEAERRQAAQCKKLDSEASAAQSTKPLESPTEELPSTSLVLTNSPNADVLGEVGDVADYGGSPCCQKDVVMQEEELPSPTEETVVEAVDQMEVVEMDEPAPDPETEEGADLTKLEVEEKGVSDLEKETNTSDFETQGQAVEQFLKPKTDTEDLKNPTDIINDLTSPVEKTPAKTPVALKVPYKTKFQSCAQETQDSYIEFPLPPPAKKTYKKSQMVILKHSSPKPPRKMSKKMTSGPLSLARAPSVNELLFPASQPLDPATIIPKESMPISDEVSGPASSESTISASRDIERQVKRSDVPTAPQSVEIQNCDAKSQAQPTSLQCLTDELQTPGPDVLPQSTEHKVPECGDDVQNIQDQVSSFEVPFPLPQLPDPASQTVHLAQVPEHGAQEQEVQIHGAQVPELADQPPESLTHDPELITLLPEFGVQEPEVATQGPDVCNQTPKPTAHILKPTVPEAESESASTTEASVRDLPAITVVAESMYGDFEQAMDHLRYRLIATRNPEEIRGGGLLKYSNLLVREFKPASETEIKTLERYMCSRFFIDFPDVNEQQRKIESYLRNHFIGEEKSKYDYLMTLRRVVNESTVCLMGHERRQTLNMITILALKVLGEQNIIPNTTNVTCYYQPAPYMADHNFSNYYIAHGQPPLIYHPYPMHIHMQTGLV